MAHARESACNRATSGLCRLCQPARSRQLSAQSHRAKKYRTMTSDPVAAVVGRGERSRRLGTVILRSVSRSFYLSIRFLPAQLREPIALAYLLARTTDTVADTTQIAGTVRIETLKILSDGIQGNAPREAIINQVAAFVPLQENAAERTLLDSLPDCLEWLEQTGGADRDDVR